MADRSFQRATVCVKRYAPRNLNCEFSTRREVLLRLTHFVISLWLIALMGCDSGTDSREQADFAIYLLKDSKLTAAQVWSQPLESLVLADSPFLATGDLKSYNWQTHEFSVSAPVDFQLAALRRTLGPTGGIPFVVVVGTERIYLGAFWYAYSSMISQVPFIDAIGNPHRINKCESVLVSEDKRIDPRIYHALKAAGILIE
jgi:hypothetical protein